ncbi:hypothetical protein VTL71DRAFT_4210 [Oculimacula yallundae]|uniref:Uncharacterized protein n=1 Tax=Oculimacula yallundae TaxID=86028 RepID=A0ABR4C553_9HELO
MSFGGDTFLTSPRYRIRQSIKPWDIEDFKAAINLVTVKGDARYEDQLWREAYEMPKAKHC